MSLLHLENLAISIGHQVVSRSLNLTLEGGQILGVLGRNGVGKSTLLYTLLGIHPSSGGRILLMDQDCRTVPRRQFARTVGMLFQENNSQMPATVLETALLGRHPFNDNPLWDNPDDLDLARRALNELGLDRLENRQVSTLSGGERQRLAIAVLLIQSPQCMLLDEPSNHLDIDYQIKILTLLRQRVADQHAAMIMASHDINLVSRFCDQVLLLLGDGEVVLGNSDAVLTEENLARAFGCKVKTLHWHERRYFVPA